MKKLIRFALLFILPFFGLAAEVLENGFTVHLHPMNQGSGYFALQLVSKNGYRTFESINPGALWIALDAVVQVKMQKDELQQKNNPLFDYANEFNYAVENLYSYFEGEMPKEEGFAFLQALKGLIAEPEWNRDSFNKVLQDSKNRLEQELQSPSYKIEMGILYLLGTESSCCSLPTPAMLEGVTLEDAKLAFQTLFQNPQDLALIAAGDFERDQLFEEIKRTFGTLPSSETSKARSQFSLLSISLPQSKRIDGLGNKENTIRLSLPLPYSLNNHNFNETDLLKEAFETALRQDAKMTLQESSSLDVALELPLYPAGENPWFVIRLLSTGAKADEEAKELVRLTQARIQNGLSDRFVTMAKEQLKTADDFWKEQEEFWIAFLANSFLMGFDPQQMVLLRREMQTIETEPLSKKLQSFPQNRYTLLITR